MRYSSAAAGALACVAFWTPPAFSQAAPPQSPPAGDGRFFNAASPETALDRFYVRVQAVFRAGAQPADLQSLADDLAKLKETACVGAPDPWKCAQQEASLDALVGGLGDMRRMITRLKSEPSVPAADFRVLDEKVKGLTIDLGIPAREAAALAAAYLSEVAPPLPVQQDIVNVLNNAASLAGSDPTLGKYLQPVNMIQSAVSVGQWEAARRLADHFFDGAGGAPKAMLRNSLRILGSVTQKLNPFSNSAGNFVQDVKVVQKDIRPAADAQSPQEFAARVQALERGLDKFAVPVPITAKEAKSVDRARRLEQYGTMLMNIGGVVPTLTTFALYLALGKLFLQGLLVVGLLPTLGGLVWGTGSSMENAVRGAWKSPSSK